MDRLVEVDIMQKAARPFFDMDTGDSIIRCLVDTGAEIPVWCFDADLLKSVFPDCEPTAFATFISGFGKGRTYADIYKIPEIILEDRNCKDRLVIHNVLVAVVPKTTIAVALIMSASMFTVTDYSVVNRTEKRYMRFEFDRDCYCVPRIVVSDDANTDDKKQIISGIDVFVQGEAFH